MRKCFSGINHGCTANLGDFATVYCERTGIAVEHAPTGLLGSEGPREVLAERLDPALVTSGSMVNLHVSDEAGGLGLCILEVGRVRHGC